MVQANCNSVASHLSSLPLHSNYHKPFPPSFFLSIDKPISVPALRAPISASLSPFSSATGSLLTSQPSGRAAGHIKMPGDHGSGRPHKNARHRRARGRGRNPEDAFRPQVVSIECEKSREGKETGSWVLLLRRNGTKSEIPHNPHASAPPDRPAARHIGSKQRGGDGEGERRIRA